MCGILAILGIAKGGDSLRQTALHLSRLLRHRGPDWSGVYCEGANIICHERLAIVGVDDGGQPLYNKTRTLVLSVNAEIYNHRPVRAQLAGTHSWLTHSDCECLIHAYAEHGEDFLKKVPINGMYAFVLYDAASDTFIAARDPIGIIPLYIGHGRDGSVWFASELKALQNHCEQFENFPPGHVYRSRTASMERFYTPMWINIDVVPKRRVTRLELREAFEAAVVRHMMADVPCGVLLSGGLDSSLVASIAARHAPYRTEEYADLTSNCDLGRPRSSADFPRLHSFCIGLKGSPDIAAAEKVAALLGTRHHSYHFTLQEGLDAISDVIFHLETYDVTSIRASTPMYLMARKIKACGVKVVLSGEGSDEMFGGYLYFHKAPNATEFHRELVRKLSMLHMYDCLRANKATMAWGVEARVPFLDREFLELVMQMDPTQKMCVDEATGKPRIEKHVLRDAFDVSRDSNADGPPTKRMKLFNGEHTGKPYLPEEILWRQKEQFSDGVGYSWIDTLRSVAEERVTDEQLAQAKFRFPNNPPTTKEGYYYRSIFAQHFPGECAAKTVPGGPSVACSTP
eukprot:RCo011476